MEHKVTIDCELCEHSKYCGTMVQSTRMHRLALANAMLDYLKKNTLVFCPIGMIEYFKEHCINYNTPITLGVEINSSERGHYIFLAI